MIRRWGLSRARGAAAVAERRLKLLYDAGSRIGATLDVTRTAEELTRFAVPRFADYATLDLVDPVLRGGEPVGGTVLRAALSGIRDDPPLYPVGTVIDFGRAAPQPIGFGSGEPVLERDMSAFGGWQEQDPDNARRIVGYGINSMIVVPLRARGVLLGMASFWRSRGTQPFEQADVSIARELVGRAAVAVDNARRYTREHTMAAALQRSLLPRGLPEQTAVQAAHRYLTARAEVSGDWFDVIPLPGARVALVVGGVTGHGLRAAVTMGRLRTAVHNFSALDLPPDELLGHLDKLVSRMDREEPQGDDEVPVTGATCLYAVYDPVTGQAVMANAGHCGPALLLPDGRVSFPPLPASPALGRGGRLPVETTESALPEGSRLVLYSAGLIEDHDRGPGAGRELLRTALTAAAGLTPAEICETVLDTVLPARCDDDIALLVARTRLVGPDRVAEWDVPSDPAAVAPTRSACARTLDTWGLRDLGYTTELILSELITNAIRYGSQPIRVRLLRDRALICEVSDGSSTSPHPRRAASTDEGGRGLFLVAQLARNWGTRYTGQGKIIWAEQSLADEPAVPDLAGILSDPSD
ncbi:SpoIIE family protein phosphatase [Streptacidiphilus sp. P02-A3a]|nr:SpoIIE family protein phosphatase [Streptacidiphilus sp. P02-A3a]